MKTTKEFPGFSYSADQLSAFAFSIDTFVISLKSGKIVTHCPEDIEAFKEWLNKHHIRDINKHNGIPKNLL